MTESICISEIDLVHSLDFLNAQKDGFYPSWTRLLLLKTIRDNISQRSKSLTVNDCVRINDNIWGHVIYLGDDVLGNIKSSQKLQLVLSVRPVRTNLKKIIPLN